MRINLNTPFSQKENAKALGARWDAKLKTWYVIDVEDLRPFAAWIPALKSGKVGNPLPMGKTIDQSSLTQSRPPVASCGCEVLPWIACIHTIELPVIEPIPATSKLTEPEKVETKCDCVVLPWDDCIHTKEQ